MCKFHEAAPGIRQGNSDILYGKWNDSMRISDMPYEKQKEQNVFLERKEEL